jgi:hypothetical protein
MRGTRPPKSRLNRWAPTKVGRHPLELPSRLLPSARVTVLLGLVGVNAQDTPVESNPDLPLEIAHLLLIDLVGYSKLLINERIELLQELNQIVRETECFRSAKARGKLSRPPLLRSLTPVL